MEELETEEKKEKFVGVTDVAEHLSVNIYSVYRWIKRGMPAYRVASIWRLRLSEVDHWLKSGKGYRMDAASIDEVVQYLAEIMPRGFTVKKLDELSAIIEKKEQK